MCGLRQRRGVDLLQACDVTEDRFQLAEEASLFGVAQAEPGQHGDVIDFASRKCHGAALSRPLGFFEREPGVSTVCSVGANPAEMYAASAA